MRLWINSWDLPERALVRGILAGEAVLAERGVTLTACLQAFVAEARKDPPGDALAAFSAAEEAALLAAFGSRSAAKKAAAGKRPASLVLVLSPGEDVHLLAT